MVLGDEEHVLRSGVAEHLRPLVGLPQLGVPVAGELGVHFAHGQRGVGVVGHGAEASGVAGEESLVEPFAVALLAGVGGHGVEAPMDEDAQLGVGEPLGVGTLVEALPCGLHRLRAQGERAEEEGYRQ